MRYSVQPTEKIRKRLGLTPEAFSIRAGYSVNAYRKAVKTGRLTPRMAREIAARFQVPLAELEELR
mgnify:CR=1 FL=1